MKILLDFFPILLFFGAYRFYGIYIGTAVLMAATVVQMATIYLIDRKLYPAMGTAGWLSWPQGRQSP